MYKNDEQVQLTLIFNQDGKMNIDLRNLENTSASVAFTRQQEGEEFVWSVLGVIHNAGDFADAPCGENVCDGEKRDPDDDHSSPHYPLQGLNLKRCNFESRQ